MTFSRMKRVSIISATVVLPAFLKYEDSTSI